MKITNTTILNYANTVVKYERNAEQLYQQAESHLAKRLKASIICRVVNSAEDWRKHAENERRRLLSVPISHLKLVLNTSLYARTINPKALAVVSKVIAELLSK